MSINFYIVNCLSRCTPCFDELSLSIATAASFHFIVSHSFHPESSSPSTLMCSLFIFSHFRAHRRQLFQATVLSVFRYFHAHYRGERERERKKRRRLKERNGEGKTAASITMRVSVYVCRDEHMQRCKYKYTTSD